MSYWQSRTASEKSSITSDVWRRSKQRREARSTVICSGQRCNTNTHMHEYTHVNRPETSQVVMYALMHMLGMHGWWKWFNSYTFMLKLLSMYLWTAFSLWLSSAESKSRSFLCSINVLYKQRKVDNVQLEWISKFSTLLLIFTPNHLLDQLISLCSKYQKRICYNIGKCAPTNMIEGFLFVCVCAHTHTRKWWCCSFTCPQHLNQHIQRELREKDLIIMDHSKLDTLLQRRCHCFLFVSW